MINKNTSREQPCDGEPSGGQQVTCDGKDDASQFSGQGGSNGNPTPDVKDHKFSNTAK